MKKKLYFQYFHLIWIWIQDFGPIWIRIQGYTINFERKNLKIFLEKKNFLSKVYFLKLFILRNFCSVESLNCEFKCYVLCLHFTLYLHVWIRIRIPNMDPDLEGS